jgi:hypothetical protein
MKRTLQSARPCGDIMRLAPVHGICRRCIHVVTHSLTKDVHAEYNLHAHSKVHVKASSSVACIHGSNRHLVRSALGQIEKNRHADSMQRTPQMCHLGMAASHQASPTRRQCHCQAPRMLWRCPRHCTPQEWMLQTGASSSPAFGALQVLNQSIVSVHSVTISVHGGVVMILTAPRPVYHHIMCVHTGVAPLGSAP